MTRVKIKFPTEKPLHITLIPVRVTDLNYGNHVGNDSILSIIHEARMQLLAAWGFTELDAGGNSLIMGDVMIAYRGESFYGDILSVKIYVDELTDRSFNLLYDITTTRLGKDIPIAHAKTGMVCFDYYEHKIAMIKEGLKGRLIGM